MTPEFAEKIDPLICELIRVVESSGIRTDLANLKQELLGKLQAMSRKLGGQDDWKLGQYALVAWLDSELAARFDVPWLEYSLEAEIFRKTSADSLFFDLAEKAIECDLADAMECFLLAFLFRFRGKLAASSKASANPTTLAKCKQWQKRMAAAVKRCAGQDEFEWVSTVRRSFEPMVLLPAGLLFWMLSFQIAMLVLFSTLIVVEILY